MEPSPKDNAEDQEVSKIMGKETTDSVADASDIDDIILLEEPDNVREEEALEEPKKKRRKTMAKGKTGMHAGASAAEKVIVIEEDPDVRAEEAKVEPKEKTMKREGETAAASEKPDPLGELWDSM